MVRLRWRSASLRRCSSTCAFSSCSTAAPTCDSIASARRVARSAVFHRHRRLALERHKPLGLHVILGARCLEELLLQRRELLRVFAVHALRHVLERPHRFLPRLLLRKAREGELEQGGGRRQAFRRARAEELARLVEHEHRGELALEPNAAERQPPHVLELPKGEQRGELVGVIPELHEASRRADRQPLPRGQVIERGLEPVARHHLAFGLEPVHEHVAARVETHERDLREAVDLGERISEGQQRRIEVGRDAEGVGERSERARRHPTGGSTASCTRRAAKLAARRRQSQSRGAPWRHSHLVALDALREACTARGNQCRRWPRIA